MKFKVKEESDKIIVSVELPHSRRTGKIIPRQLIRTEDVLLELSNRGVEYGRVLETTTVKNWREHTRNILTAIGPSRVTSILHLVLPFMIFARTF